MLQAIEQVTDIEGSISKGAGAGKCFSAAAGFRFCGDGKDFAFGGELNDFSIDDRKAL